jgi:hypothetical protein
MLPSHCSQINLILLHMAANKAAKHLNLTKEINNEVRTIDLNIVETLKSIDLMERRAPTITCIMLEPPQVGLDHQFKVILHHVKTFNQVAQ